MNGFIFLLRSRASYEVEDNFQESLFEFFWVIVLTLWQKDSERLWKIFIKVFKLSFK